MGSINTQTPASGHLLHRSLIHQPHEVKSAKGLELQLTSGQVVLDACAGAAVALIGHGNNEVREAILEQVGKVSYIHTQAYTTPVAEDLADFILEGKPFGLEKALFLGSGSEAIEAAMKLARQHFFEKGEVERRHFVSRKQSYHGNTIGAMSLSGNLARKAPYQGFDYPYVSQVSPAYAYQYKRDSETLEDFSERLVREAEDEFLRVGPQTVIAFVAETVVGATSGCVVPPPGYLKGIRQLCDKYGILLILDEIMCGIGRTGTYFAFEQEDIVPDIVTVAKGLGGGYAPISGVLIHEKVINVLRNGSNAFNHGHTYQAHPVSCAAALAVQKILRRDRLVERSAELGVYLESLLRKRLGGCKSVGEIRGRGLFWGIEFVRDQQSKECFDSSIGFGIRVQQEAFRRGVAVYPGAGTVHGFRGDHVMVSPPFTVTKDQLQIIVETLRDAILAEEEKLVQKAW